MKPAQTLPPRYSLAWDVNMKRDKRLNALLQLAGAFWMALVGAPLFWLVRFLRPDVGAKVWLSVEVPALVNFVLAVIASIVLHEMVHGAFFWWFSGHPPKFGIGPGYAYAAMPDWYFPKRPYLWVGISPLVTLTALGLAFIPALPGTWVMAFFWGLVVNAGGAIGDVYICLRIAREAADVWVKDTGDGFEVYRPAAD